MIISPHQQGTPEWLADRAGKFTASNLGPYVLDPVAVNLTVDDIKAALDRLEIPRKGAIKKDDLLALLPDLAPYQELTPGASTAIIASIREDRIARLKAQDFDDLTYGEQILLEREIAIEEKEARNFEFNIPVQFGKRLEPEARSAYESLTGFEVEEIGFVTHDDGGFGCSPDGLIYYMDDYSHGLEIKCPVYTTHIAWLIADVLPECHKLQVHASMATTGIREWHFFSYCPGEKPLLVKVAWDSTTDRVLAGLKTLVSEKAKMKKRLRMIWGITGNDQGQSIRTGSPGMARYPSSLGPGCRVKVDSSSTYKGRYGTITEVNGMPDRWFVAIDDDDRFADVSFYARELIYIPEDNAPAQTPPDSGTKNHE